MDEYDDFDDYESGPFCSHWGDPGDCLAECDSCGQSCDLHYTNGAWDTCPPVKE